jgi:hypothetical protein
MTRIDSDSRWTLLVLATLVVAAMTGLVTAMDMTVDTPAHDPGFYVHHFDYDPPAGTNRRR